MATNLFTNFHWKLVTLSVVLCLLCMYVMWLIPIRRFIPGGIFTGPTDWGVLVLSTLILFPMMTGFVIFRLATEYKWIHAVTSVILIFLIVVVYIDVRGQLEHRQLEAKTHLVIGGTPKIVVVFDKAEDQDQDGTFEALVIEAEMELPIGGKSYDIRVVLVDPKGAVIARQHKRVSLIPSKQPEHTTVRKMVTFIFEGKNISQHGVDGPYTLQNFYVRSEVAGQVLHRQIVHTTRAYKASEFAND